MNTERKFRKTRLAPTPSGFLHLGNVLSFALTAGLARNSKARILLRIDDLDRERVEKKYVQDIFDTLHFLEIPWDEGPRNYQEYKSEYSQLHRMSVYQRALQQLNDSRNIFACDCSRATVAGSNPEGMYTGTCLDKHIPVEQPNVCWRVITEENVILSVKTLSGKTISTPLPQSMRYFIVRKKDGFPAYQLASLIDDHYFGIDLIVRGEDLWPSTLAQHYLSSLFVDDGFANTSFYHHTLIHEGSGRKLSKSAGDMSVQYLRRQGKKASEVYAAIGKAIGSAEPVQDFQSLCNWCMQPGISTGGYKH